MNYLRRIVDDELDELFPEVPALALDGPKAVGKTTTARQRVVGLMRLDSVMRESVAADPTQVLRRQRPILIDEWQKVPEVWDVVRHAVDEDSAGGQFLLAGSASPQQGSTQHSGAGRIGRLRMRPMTLSERGLVEPTVSLRELLSGRGRPIGGESEFTLDDYVYEITASGFPGIRTMSPRPRRFQLDSYLSNAVDQDVPEQGLAVRRPDAVLAWLRAYAAATSTTASYSQILDAATPGQGDKPAYSTAITYRDVLSRLWLLDPVPAWAPAGNVLTRLGQAPKHHLADPALAARLLGLNPEALLDGEGRPIDSRTGSMLGALFESLATLCVRVAAQASEATVGHLRTRNGDHEVDLVVCRADGRVVAVKVKLSSSIGDRDIKHLHWLKEKMGTDLLDAIVINTGPVAYRRRDGIGVVPLALLAI